MTEQQDRALTIKQVAEFLNISNQMVYNLIRDNEIDAFKIGSAVRILHSDLSKYIEKQKDSFRGKDTRSAGPAEIRLSGVSTSAGEFMLKDFSCTFRQGAVNALIGPCGSGKTVLLRCIAGLQDYTGDILIGNTSINDLDPKNRRIGFLFQNQRLFPHMSGKRNITFQSEETISDKELADLLSECGLSPEVIDLKKDSLMIPPGIRQLALIVRKKMQQFSTLLLDDPFRNIEPHVRQYVNAIIRSMSDIHGITIILATSEVRDLSGTADNVTVISEGKLLQNGSVEEVYRNPADIQTMKLLSYFNVNTCRVDIKHGSAHPWEISSGRKDGPALMAFRADEISISERGVPASIIEEQFYDGRKKLARVSAGENGDEFNLLIGTETQDEFRFIPTHPVFFDE